MVSSGKKPVMNEPCLSIQHFGPSASNIGLAGVAEVGAVTAR